MSSKYKIRNQEYPHFVSFSVVYWIDLFVRLTYNEVLIDSLKYCQTHKGLILYAWCIMPSHVHLIIGTEENPMEDILRDFKSFTSRELKHAIQNNSQESRKEWMLWMMERAGVKNSNNNKWQLWQQNNHPIELSNNQMIDQRIDYLHNNPVEAGFVEYPQDWLFSSARDYCGEKGLLDVFVVE